MKELSSIRKQILELQEKEKQLIQEGKAQAIEQIKALMSASGVTIADLGNKKKSKSSGAATVLYKDGNNTWSGSRGRKPKWVNEHIKNGVDIEKFRL